jgi:hypothetical protein
LIEAIAHLLFLGGKTSPMPSWRLDFQEVHRKPDATACPRFGLENQCVFAPTELL